MEELGDRAVVAASAVIRRLGDDGNRRPGESFGRVEAGRGARAVQDKDVVNTAAAQLVDEQWKGCAPESTGDADHRPAVDDTEAVPERAERVERITRLQLREQPRPRADRLEDEAAVVVLGPGDAERAPQQRRGAPAAAQLRE